MNQLINKKIPGMVPQKETIADDFMLVMRQPNPGFFIDMEKWKMIPDYEYYISDRGRIKSRNGNLLNGSSARGYKRIGLWKGGIVNYKYIARLVADAFIPNEGNKPCINHIDCDISNNWVDNLEWVTYSENLDHAYKNGLIDTGKRRAPQKLNDLQVSIIRQSKELTGAELSRIFGVSPGHISMIKNNKRCL